MSASNPEVKSALRVVDDRLCIGGLAYGQDYTVRLLAGFPGSNGAKLNDEMKVDVALGARPAVVTLPGKGFILPRGTTAGLPITTINVSKVGIAVYRVNERGHRPLRQRPLRRRPTPAPSRSPNRGRCAAG